MTILLICSLIANVGFIICIWMMLKLFRKLKDRLSSLGFASMTEPSLPSGVNSAALSQEDLTKLSAALSTYAEQFTTTTDPEAHD